MSVSGIIRGKFYRTQLSVIPLHCVSEVPVAPENINFHVGNPPLIRIMRGGEGEQDARFLL